jgi:hypothetical protein
MDEFWQEAELRRIRALPCLCEPCRACKGGDLLTTHGWRCCKGCDGLGITTYCERCEQITELELSLGSARRETHGHFGSF